jgi:hypothetical protein
MAAQKRPGDKRELRQLEYQLRLGRTFGDDARGSGCAGVLYELDTRRGGGVAGTMGCNGSPEPFAVEQGSASTPGARQPRQVRSATISAVSFTYTSDLQRTHRMTAARKKIREELVLDIAAGGEIADQPGGLLREAAVSVGVDVGGAKRHLGDDSLPG